MKRAKFWAAGLICMAILIRPEPAVAGAQRAMRLWCGSVAPSLFPFLALLPMLTGPEACAAYNGAFSRLMRPLFRLPGAAAPALAVGLISGSPGGALAARSIAASAGLPKAEARRIALCMAGLSPAYLVLGVGQGLYGSAKLGFQLALLQLGVQLLLLFASRWLYNIEERAGSEVAPVPHQKNPMAAAVETVLVICGYMVLFSAIASVLASFLGKGAGMAILLTADLPSGLAELAQHNLQGKFLIQGAAIGFGGLCISAQNLDALRPLGVKPGEYFAHRAAAASLMACGSGLLLCKNSGEIVTFAAIHHQSYAISLLAAALISIPTLIFLSTSLFLNIRKSRI